VKTSKTTITRKIAGRSYSVEVSDVADPETGESLVTADELARAELAIAAGVAADGPPSGGAFSWMRRVLGLTAKQLATLLDVKVRTISRWETGAGAVNRTAWLALGDLVLEAAGKPPEARARLQRIADGFRPSRERRVDLG
jgi:transcriptional regulator with XRE-family HTH domain